MRRRDVRPSRDVDDRVRIDIEKSKFIFFLVQWIDRRWMETVGRDAGVDAFAERSWIFRSYDRPFVRSYDRPFGVLKTRINIEKSHRRISVQTARLRGNKPHPRRFWLLIRRRKSLMMTG